MGDQAARRDLFHRRSPSLQWISTSANSLDNISTSLSINETEPFFSNISENILFSHLTKSDFVLIYLDDTR